MKELEKTEYLRSLLTFYLKGIIYTENGFIKFRQPNTLLGIIPLGSKEESLLIKQIVGINTSFKFEFSFFIFGLALVIVGIPTIILSIVGIMLLISAFQTDFEISTTGSAKKHVFFIVFDNGKMYKVKEYIESALAQK